MLFEESRPTQTSFLGSEPSLRPAPSTRYQGSKLKLLDWLWTHFEQLSFNSSLDAFGGTGSVAYLLKANSKQVTYNDHCQFNYHVGHALIANCRTRLTQVDIDFILTRDLSYEYDDFIASTFENIYFTDDENRWLDVVCQNIHRIPDTLKRSLAFYATFQSCIIKRPYNLFHRKNLYMRTADVKRGFGNKSTWDTPFEEHFRAFVREINGAVFDSGIDCQATCADAIQVAGDFDLVYIDTPYLNGKGVGVDYLQFYHFLEGMTDYKSWASRVDWRKKHRPLIAARSPWSDPKKARDAFISLFERYACSTLVVSYRSDGIPSELELYNLLRRYKSKVRCIHFGDYKYVLSKNSESREILFIAQ